MKRQCIESRYPEDEEIDASLRHRTWATHSALLHPFLLYRHQADLSRFHIAQQRRSPLASTLSDEAFLEMSYEEYLEVHSRSNNCGSNRQLCHSQVLYTWLISYIIAIDSTEDTPGNLRIGGNCRRGHIVQFTSESISAKWPLSCVVDGDICIEVWS